MSAQDVARRFPEIASTRTWSRCLAVLDAILSPDWEYRYFSFDADWGDSAEMASMRNGSGDEYSIVFDKHGAFVRGFDHESPLSPWAQNPPGVVSGLVDDIPPILRQHLTEPAFSLDGTLAITVCIWREALDSRWHVGRISDSALRQADDGADWLFEVLDGRPESYVAFAEDYYERSVYLDAVSQVFQQQPLTSQFISSLNPDGTANAILKEARQMGYPVGP